MKRLGAAAILCLWFCASTVEAQLGTSFTYQGHLSDADAPANGPYAFEFTLWDDPTAASPGNLLGTNAIPSVPVMSGQFTVSLDFGSGVFAGSKRWLEIRVKPFGGGSYTTLSPRQELVPTPNALYAAAAGTAATAAAVTGTLGVANGGTGAIDPDAARANLSAARSGANADITSLAGLTTPLAIAQGGTGSATQAFVDLSTVQTVGGGKTFADKLSVSSNDGAVFGGTFGSGSIPATGAGARLMWYPAKAAFRAGATDGPEWADASIGNYSVALGAATTASGAYTTAFGQGARAQAYSSTALGRSNVAAGNPTAWVDTDPLLVVGNGTPGVSSSNALTLLKNGNLTIAGTLTQNSDARLKKEVVALDGVLGRLEGVRGVSYQFIDAQSGPSGRQIGLLAQELRERFPELVHEASDGKLAVAYGNFTAVLLEAVKEQQLQLAAQQAEIARQRALLSAQEARLCALERQLDGGLKGEARDGKDR